MTVHIAPAIRGLEDAAQVAGLIIPQNSDGFVALKQLENLNQVSRPSVYKTWILNNTAPFTPPSK